ncbi:hypothetical protein [Pseudoxanthomonas sp.]|uniref:hypothetical protein n=1 Tax=Pseudoxanthomonas sp. TaxID=1871049 RepID=UPI002603FED3|nr:hypothetical protein [Pseudoxanthomonas sp.]WDS34917.1 MAG: hypothetical protein O8I58_11055 [Pseudoxanthomonas sp.]
MALQALLGLPMVCATAFALVIALVAPQVPGRGLARWGAALMLASQLGALAVSVGQMSLIQHSLAQGSDGLRQVQLVIGMVHMGLGVVAVVGICLLACGFLRTARVAARATP